LTLASTTTAVDDGRGLLSAAVTAGIEGEEWDAEDQTLEEYLQDYADEYGWEDPSVIIHYADGTKGTVTKAVKK
jgi:hypothetical protein